jgi:hypothetical protein
MSELTQSSTQNDEGDVAVPERPKSKYSLVEIEQGVRIERVGGMVVEAVYQDTYITIGRANVGLYQFDELAKYVAVGFVEQMNLRTLRQEDDAVEMIVRALRGRLYPQWRRIVEQVAPAEVVKLAKLMWSSTRKDAAVLHLPGLYTDAYQFVRRDLEKYHACRLYAKSLDETNIPSDSYLDILMDWRGRLSPTVPNKALNKTLDKLPPAVSFRQIQRLALLKMEEPITSRLHLIFALSAADHRNFGLHERTVMRANTAMVKEAAEVFDFQLRHNSRTSAIEDVARYILDYPEAYGGDLIGLARRSAEWHQEVDRMERWGLPDEYVLPRPPEVDLAALEGIGIRLLDTAGAVYAEGREMHHCVGSYASAAASGQCYLFHVDHLDTQATIEVYPDGRVVQACGPYNRKTRACEYGVAMLERAFSKPMPTALNQLSE